MKKFQDYPDLKDIAMYRLDDYQVRASTFINKQVDVVAMTAMGLAGEVGEYVEIIKKDMFHGRPLNYPDIVSELGDILWYLAGACTAHGLDLSYVAQQNILKLSKRFPNGFETGAGKDRQD